MVLQVDVPGVHTVIATNIPFVVVPSAVMAATFAAGCVDVPPLPPVLPPPLLLPPELPTEPDPPPHPESAATQSAAITQIWVAALKSAFWARQTCGILTPLR